jgi:protein-L-isoaspartate(D-aspartate) O-methyltransferase
MVRTIEVQVHDLSPAVGHDHIDTRVLAVIGTIPRHVFVPEDLREFSYENGPLPSGFGQAVSQPLIVALMTDVLNVDRTSVVLD